MLPFSRPSCYSKTRPPSCALGTSFYTVSKGSDLMTYASDNYTSYSVPSRLREHHPTLFAALTPTTSKKRESSVTQQTIESSVAKVPSSQEIAHNTRSLHML